MMPDYRPLLSLVELTLRCNMRCAHCGSTAGRGRPDEMTDGEIETVIRDLARLGAEDVVLLGGEPLLHPGWDRFCALVRDEGMAPVLVTNGLLVDAGAAARMQAAGVHRVGVSIDGADAATHESIRRMKGSFARAQRAVDVLLDAGITCTVITTVSKANVGGLERMRDGLVGRGCGWQIQMATPNGARFDRSSFLSREEFRDVARFISRCRAEFSLEDLPVAGAHDIGYCSSELRNYAQVPEWHGCLGGISTVGIQSDGRVKPCLSMDERFVEGDVRREGLVTVWKDPERFERNRRFRPDMLEGGCRGCEHGPTCRAGCPDVAWNTTGSIWDNPYCLYRMEKGR